MTVWNAQDPCSSSTPSHRDANICWFGRAPSSAAKGTGKQRNDNADGYRCQGRVRSQDENMARAEQCVDQERRDRCIQIVDARQARCLRAGNSNRNQHRRQRRYRAEGTLPHIEVALQPLEPVLQWALTPKPGRVPLAALSCASLTIGPARILSRLSPPWQTEIVQRCVRPGSWA